jgi:hypothetical protein
VGKGFRGLNGKEGFRGLSVEEGFKVWRKG